MCLHINLVHLYFGSAFGSIDNSETSFFEVLILSALVSFSGWYGAHCMTHIRWFGLVPDGI